MGRYFFGFGVMEDFPQRGKGGKRSFEVGLSVVGGGYVGLEREVKSISRQDAKTQRRMGRGFGGWGRWGDVF
jgi:hypothetical protein